MFILFVYLICFVEIVKEANCHRHPDVGLNVGQLITKYGYPFENYTVTTEDGYILGLHRIPHGRTNGNATNKKPVVFLMPGIFCSSADWVNMGPSNSLGFILADNGYDVWLGNYRGTTWGRKHITLNPDKDKKKFWNFSFHEVGYYDAPAHIDYVLAATNQTQLYYVGHSQGTTSFFVMASLRPEYNEKIRFMGALSPPVFMGNVESRILHFLAAFERQIQEFIARHEFYEILRHTPLLTLIGQLFCNDDSPFQQHCANVFFTISGRSENQLNKTMIPVIASNTPAGGSMKQFQHYAQLYHSGSFHQYDHGKVNNQKVYGRSTPPEYDLSKVSAPVAIYYSDNDLLVSPKDVEFTASKLKNVSSMKLIRGFNHLDFMWAIDVVPFLYNDLLKQLKQF